MKDMRKSVKKLSRIAGLLSEIWSIDLPNIKKNYHYIAVFYY